MTVYSPVVPLEEEPAPDRIGNLVIHDMSPEDAKAALAEMQRAWNRNKPVLDKLSPDGIRDMSPEQATAALAEISGRPTDATGNPIPLPPDSGIISSDELQARHYEETKDHLEKHGFPLRGTPVGDDLWNMIEGRSPVSAEMQKAVEKKLEVMTADAEWCRKLSAGDQDAKRQLYIANGIITAAKLQRPLDQSSS